MNIDLPSIAFEDDCQRLLFVGCVDHTGKVGLGPDRHSFHRSDEIALAEGKVGCHDSFDQEHGVRRSAGSDVHGERRPPCFHFFMAEDMNLRRGRRNEHDRGAAFEFCRVRTDP